MIYQLPTGRAVEMTIDEYLSMSDADLRHLSARRNGSNLSPFFDSALQDLSVEDIGLPSDGVPQPIDLEEFTEEDLLELDLIEEGQKFSDLDFRELDCEE